MAKNFDDGSYSCTPGIDLIAKVLAGKCKMQYTKAKVGKGNLELSENPKDQTNVKDYVMDAQIAAITNPSNGECQVTIQINSANVENGFYATGILLYARGESGEDVPYTYLVMENEPEWIRPKTSDIGKLATFDLVVAVGDVDSVSAVIDTDSVMTRRASEALLADTVGEAPAYSPDSPYAVGDTVTHEGKTYRCKTAITSEAWTESHWERVDLYGEVGTLQGETAAQFEMHDRKYAGVDLSVVFKDEIAAYIAGAGASEYAKVQAHADGHEAELKAWLWMKHRIDTHNYEGIHVGDWLPMTIHCQHTNCAECAFHTECAGSLHETGETHKMQVAGIDTYRETIIQEWHHKYSVKEKAPVPHHIDFISKDLLTKPIKWNNTAVNSGEYCGKWVCDAECPNFSNKASCGYHKAAATTTNCTNCAKNSTCKYYLQKDSASDFCEDAGNDCPYNTSHIRAFLEFLYEHSVKNAYDGIITPKTMIMERRGYQYTNPQLTDSTGWHWYDMGKFWLPTEFEVFGAVVWGTVGWSSGQAVQYPIFTGRWEDKIKYIGPGGTSRSTWWEACARSASSSYACYVYTNGTAGYNSAAYAGIRVPVCFRIAATPAA